MAEPTGVVLVTGAAGALGRAVCAAFADRGDRVAALDRDAQALRSAFDGGPIRQVPVDLLDAGATEAAVRATIATEGAPGALCCVAGGFAMGPTVAEQDPDGYRDLMAMNFLTTLHAIQAALPAMRQAGSGCILTVGAMAAQAGKPRMSAYCVAKGAVMRLTESLAAELKGSGLRANCLLPDIIDTPANRAAMPDAPFDNWVKPAEIAAVMAFLASPAGVAIHGALVPVPGGR